MTHHLTAEHLDDDLKECIERCSDCHDVCAATVIHCLTMGGEHASVEHIRTLLDCAQICETSRDFMLRGSDRHADVCRICAETCERCADSCESIGAGDEVMARCAEICRSCGESCRQMAGATAR